MIKLAVSLPDIKINGVESFKIKSDFKLYSDTTRFYTADNGGIISISSDGVCVILGEFNKCELEAFVEFLSPEQIVISGDFSGKLSIKGYLPYCFNVVKKKAVKKAEINPSDIKSDKIFKLLKAADNFNLPPFGDFAVDYCRRKNNGNLEAVIIEDKAAAVAFTCEDSALLCGVVSLKKGLGSAALESLEARLSGKTVYAETSDEVLPFYIKNGYKICGRLLRLKKCEERYELL